MPRPIGDASGSTELVVAFRSCEKGVLQKTRVPFSKRAGVAPVYGGGSPTVRATLVLELQRK